MIPKIIHLCWFGDSTYPVEVKVCLDTWKRILPDYEIRLWDYAAAQSIGSNYINEALSVKNGPSLLMQYASMLYIKKEESTWIAIFFYINALTNLFLNMDLPHSTNVPKPAKRNSACKLHSLWVKKEIRQKIGKKY